MRPDEHKKKKNAAYKKKHNIHADKKSDIATQVKNDCSRTDRVVDDCLQTNRRPRPASSQVK